MKKGKIKEITKSEYEEIKKARNSTKFGIGDQTLNYPIAEINGKYYISDNCNDLLLTPEKTLTNEDKFLTN